MVGVVWAEWGLRLLSTQPEAQEVQGRAASFLPLCLPAGGLSRIRLGQLTLCPSPTTPSLFPNSICGCGRTGSLPGPPSPATHTGLMLAQPNLLHFVLGVESLGPPQPRNSGKLLGPGTGKGMAGTEFFTGRVSHLQEGILALGRVAMKAGWNGGPGGPYLKAGARPSVWVGSDPLHPVPQLLGLLQQLYALRLVSGAPPVFLWKPSWP